MTAVDREFASPTTAGSSAEVNAGSALDREGLYRFASACAGDRDVLARLGLHPNERTWVELDGPGGSEAWVIGWPPGTTTGWHDHGGSQGAFVIAHGELHEYTLDIAVPTVHGASVPVVPHAAERLALGVGSGRHFGADHIHTMVNESSTDTAVSVHVYDPPLPWMRKYRFADGLFTMTGIEYADEW